MPYFVYILRTSSNTLYIGQTNNLEKRIQEHKKKITKSARYIRYFSSFDLVYKEAHPTRKEAMQREIQLKKWSRTKKEALIKVWYNQSINTKPTVDELVDKFLKKGGRIDKYYLQSWNKNKPTLVYLNGWFSGKNIREAILKALT